MNKPIKKNWGETVILLQQQITVSPQFFLIGLFINYFINYLIRRLSLNNSFNNL